MFLGAAATALPVGMEVMRKPFALDDMIARVRALLAAKSSAAAPEA